MAVVTGERDGVFGKGIYVAVPLRPALSEIIENTAIDFFPYRAVDGIDSVKSVFEIDGEFVDLTATFSRNPMFNTRIYDMAGVDTRGHTTLHISALGTSQKHVEDVVDNVTGLFGDMIDLTMKDPLLSQINSAMYGILADFAVSRKFFDRYSAIKSMMHAENKIGQKKLTRGVLINVLTHMMGNVLPNFPDSYDIRLVNRTGCTYEGMPLELSLVYMDGPRLNPLVYGTFLSRNHEDGCPAWETHQCDQSRSYVGYLLSPDGVIFGSSSLLPGSVQTYSDQESGATGEVNSCLKALNSLSIDAPWQEFESGVVDVSTSLSLTPGMSDELTKLTGLIYRSGQGTTSRI
ncbi:MAG: hypothetical protein ABIJ08_07600 [Nanoarchaeota archaeon]